MIDIKAHAERARRRADEAALILAAYPKAYQPPMKDGWECSGAELQDIWVASKLKPLDCNHVLIMGHRDRAARDRIGTCLVAARRFGEYSFVVKNLSMFRNESAGNLLDSMKTENPPLYQDLVAFVAEQYETRYGLPGFDCEVED